MPVSNSDPDARGPNAKLYRAFDGPPPFGPACLRLRLLIASGAAAEPRAGSPVLAGAARHRQAAHLRSLAPLGSRGYSAGWKP